MVLHWVAMSDESRSEHETPSFKARIKRVITPAQRPTPLASIHPSPLASATIRNGRLSPVVEYPWGAASPIETTISCGNGRDSGSEEADMLGRDASKIHVNVRHEMLSEPNSLSKIDEDKA